MPRYMLDTDIASYIMNGTSAKVFERLARVDVADVCISAITKAELMYGAANSPRQARDQERLKLFLRHVDVLDFPEEAAEHYGRIRANLKQSGQMIGANDLLIAAHASSRRLILVTNNVREYRRVDGLKLENWTE